MIQNIVLFVTVDHGQERPFNSADLDHLAAIAADALSDNPDLNPNSGRVITAAVT